MRDFLGRKTEEQIKLIKALLMLKNKGRKKFSSKDISEICGIPSKNFAGAFMALANPCGKFPPLVLRAGRERIETTSGDRRYVQLWKINSDFDWRTLGEEIKNC